MKRRDLLRTALASPLAAAPALGRGRRPGEARRPDGEPMPNILWICTDQQRYDTIEELNNPYIRTPNFRRLMAESTTFTHAFVQAPVCSPSRASFVTGRYPRTTGLRWNGQRINPSERLVPRILAEYGYECGLSGKLHLAPCHGGRVETRHRINDGYHQFWWSHDLQDAWPGENQWRNWLEREGVKWPDPPRDSRAWAVPIDRKYHQSAWCVDRAIDFMRQQRSYGPWLMSVNIFQPHHPFWPVKEFMDRYDPEKLPPPSFQEGELETKPDYQRRQHTLGYGGRSFNETSELDRRRITAAYYAMIEQSDFEIGRALDALDESGQAENTIVIVTSDHGELLGDHGMYLKGPYFYDCSMRVPLMIRWPTRYRAGQRVDALVEMVDLAPTLLEAAGIAPEPQMQGRPLTGILEGKTTTHRDSVYMEMYDSGSRAGGPAMVTAVRTETHKLVVYHSLDTGELYDLTKDPGEQRNLWSDPNSRDVRERMLVKMTHRMAGTIDPLPPKNAPW